jgi:hypothetical protein
LPDAAALLASARRDLARLPALLDALLTDLDDTLWRARPLPDEWSPVEIVCHLRDEEAEDFGARIRVVVDGGHAFARIDPAQWAIDRRYRDDDPATALTLLKQRRSANLDYLAAIDAARLDHAVDLQSGGALSGRDLLAAWVAHDRLHVAQIVATITRVDADRLAPLRTEYAGPIPYQKP